MIWIFFTGQLAHWTLCTFFPKMAILTALGGEKEKRAGGPGQKRSPSEATALVADSLVRFVADSLGRLEGVAAWAMTEAARLRDGPEAGLGLEDAPAAAVPRDLHHGHDSENHES